MKHLIILIILIAGVTAAAKPHDRMRQLDTNNDGQITLAEFEAGTAEKFAKLDADGDGVLTQTDYEAHRAERKARRGDRMIHRMGAHLARRADADGDRVVTQEEWNNFVAELPVDENGAIDFEQIARNHRRRMTTDGNPFDLDGDGAVTPADATQLFSSLDKDGNGELAGRELSRGGHGRRGHGGADGHAAHMFRFLDSNEDGEVSSDEWQAHFSQLDANGDGSVTPDELPQRPGHR